MKIVNVSTTEQLTKFLSLSNRTSWEEEIANEYFWPLKHQEACRDDDFDQRREWAFALCEKGKALYWEYLTGIIATYAPAPKGILQDEVRDLVTRVILKVIFGKELDSGLAQKAIKEYDRRIKLTKLKDTKLRLTFVRTFSKHIKEEWLNPKPRSLLALAKKQFPLSEELIHQLLSVFLLTGTIQLSDATIHCILAKDNFTQTMLRYPVNKFITREDEGGAVYSLRPELFNKKAIKTGEGCGKWLFGDGPRRCPAFYFAPKFVEMLSNFYQDYNLCIADIKHTRSLDLEILFSTTEPVKITQWAKIRAKGRYLFNTCAIGAIVVWRLLWKKISKPEPYICLLK